MTTPTLNWSLAHAADRYEIHIYDVAAGRLMVQRDNLTASSFTANLTAGRRYTAFVRAINAAGHGDWSTSLEFDVAANA